MQRILQYIDSPNIAELLDEKTLQKIGERVCEDYGKDRDTMKDWSDMIDRGMKIAEPAKAPKSWPWDGASNYKSPLIYEAVIAFGDRATSEILAKKDLVKGCIVGQDTPEKQMRMNRVSRFMNWQFNYEMPEWRKAQEQALYALAAVGVFFKKTFFDPTEGKNVSRPIFYPNFAVSQNLCSLDESDSRFTECKNYSDNEIKERVRVGIWLDQEYTNDDKDGEEGDESEDKDITDDFIEQFTSYDIDGDGYAEPYIITVHKSTMKVARIVARYSKDSIFVKAGEGVVMPLSRAEQSAIAEAAKAELANVANMQPDQAEAMTPEKMLEKVQKQAYKGLKIVKIKPVSMITKYGFVVAPNGTYLNWGYLHLLSAYAEQINTTTNQLVDAGTLANIPGGFKSKEFRSNKSPMRVRPGEFTQVDVPATVMQQGLIPHQFKEPSQALMAMNEQAKAEVRNLSATVDMAGVIAPNAPAATTLGILQEKLIPTTTLITRILQAMGEEFNKMFDLNAKYTDPMLYQQVLDEPADYAQDFTRAGYDIEPVADGSKSSQFQKMQTASVLIELSMLIKEQGGNVQPILGKVFDAIGETELAAQVFTQQTDPQLMAMQQEILAAQQQSAQLQAANNELLQKQHEIKMAELSLRERELQRKEAELQIKAQQNQQEFELGMAKTSAELGIKTSESQNKMAAETERTLADADLKAAQTAKTMAETQQIMAPKVEVTVQPMRGD